MCCRFFHRQSTLFTREEQLRKEKENQEQYKWVLPNPPCGSKTHNKEHSDNSISIECYFTQEWKLFHY